MSVSAGAVLNATAGWATTISDMAGVPLPIVSQPLQACVTELIEPFPELRHRLFEPACVCQSERQRASWSSAPKWIHTRPTAPGLRLPTLEQMAAYTLELFPQLHGIKILRQWAGVCDMTPDFAPIMGPAAEQLDNFFMDVGWGTWGFKAGPIAGKMHGRDHRERARPAMLDSSPLRRLDFSTGKLLGEKAAASVST